MTLSKNKLILALVMLGPAVLPAFLVLLALLHKPDQTKSDILYINAALTEYKKAHPTLPVGDSQAIFHSLMVAGEKSSDFLKFTHTNTSNEPLDSWGTPYRIEMAGDKAFLIRSAG